MNFSEFHFLRPAWLLTLLPAAYLLYQLYRRQGGRGQWLEICDAELLPFLLQSTPSAPQRSHWLAAALAVLLAVTALAGPTFRRLPTPAFRNDSALVIALNLSPAMDAADVKPSRAVKARFKIADLLKQRKDGQTALLVYSGAAFTVTPLTNDVNTIASQLEALSPEIMPSNGDQPETAVRKAVDLLRQAGVAQGHILLITGTAGDNPDATVAALNGYRLSVLAIGSEEGAPIAQSGGGFVKDAAGNIVLAKLESEQLRQLAASGNGLYVAAGADDADINRLSRLFNTVEDPNKALQDDLQLQQWDEAGPWLLLLILPWAALRFRKGLLLWLAFVILPYSRDSQALDWDGLWRNANQQAAQAFNAQQYQQAAETFASPEWRAAAQYKAGQYQEAAATLKDVQTADAQYNRGNALAQAGQLQEAVTAYDQALKLQPGHADALYNKELVEKRLREQQEKEQQNPEHKQAEEQEKQNRDKQNQDKQGQDQKPGQDQNDSEQRQAENKPAKPEDKQADQSPAEQSNAGKPEKPQSAEQKPADAGAEKAEPDKDKPEQANAAQDAKSAAEQKEQQRAADQLLKRIPDEPTGLLKRKFKYQYSRQGAASGQ